MADYRKQFADALNAQQSATDPLQQQLEQQLQGPGSRNIAPTVKLLDSFGGTNIASTLPQEESRADKLKQLLALRQGQQGQKLSGLQALAKMQNDSEDRSYERAFKEKMYGLQLAKAKQKAGQAPKQSGDILQKLGYTTTLKKELPKLLDLYKSGGGGSVRPGMVQFFGQNDVERTVDALAENYGRLQSGGAINKDEEVRFKARLGGMMDSPEIRIRKLAQIMEEIDDKHNLYGGSPVGGGAARQPSNGGGNLEDMSIEELELLNSSLGGR